MNATRPALLAAAGLIALTACGGSGLSKADYVSQATTICKQLTGDLQKIEPPTSPEKVNEFFDKSLSVFADGVDKLKKLDPPSADADKIKKALTDPLGERLSALKDAQPKIKKAVESNDPTAAFKDLKDPIAEAGPKAEVDKTFLSGYGLNDCAAAAN